MQDFVVNVPSPVGDWGVVGTQLGVTTVLLPHQHLNASRAVAPDPVLDAADQLAQYFAGERQSFTASLVPATATAFQLDVWSALRDIPFGQVRTYGEIAAAIERPRAMRAVGNANHANPWPIIVPCHRVVAANGIGGYGGGLTVKRFLLDLEGVTYENSD